MRDAIIYKDDSFSVGLSDLIPSYISDLSIDDLDQKKLDESGIKVNIAIDGYKVYPQVFSSMNGKNCVSTAKLSNHTFGTVIND